MGVALVAAGIIENAREEYKKGNKTILINCIQNNLVRRESLFDKEKNITFNQACEEDTEIQEAFTCQEAKNKELSQRNVNSNRIFSDKNLWESAADRTIDEQLAINRRIKEASAKKNQSFADRMMDVGRPRNAAGVLSRNR